MSTEQEAPSNSPKGKEEEVEVVQTNEQLYLQALRMTLSLIYAHIDESQIPEVQTQARMFADMATGLTLFDAAAGAQADLIEDLDLEGLMGVVRQLIGADLRTVEFLRALGPEGQNKLARLMRFFLRLSKKIKEGAAAE